MVHYGWACAASWQMLRHASVWEPAVKRSRTQGCGCYTASINTGSPSCYGLPTRGETRIWCNMTSTELSGKLSVHQHPRLKGELFAFFAPLLRKSIASTFRQRRPPQCAKCAATLETSAWVFLRTTPMKKAAFGSKSTALSIMSAGTRAAQPATSLAAAVPPRSAPAPPVCASFHSIRLIALDEASYLTQPEDPEASLMCHLSSARSLVD